MKTLFLISTMVAATLGFTNWRIGLEWSVFEHFTILISLGGAVSSDLAPEERLRRDYFFGVAWDP